MSGTKKTARARALLVGAAIALATAAIPAATAGATAADSDALVFVPYNGQTATIWRNGNVVQPANVSASDPFEGAFSGAAGSDIFLYTPGSAPDGILHVAPSGTTATSSFKPLNVGGTFQPLVGDFDGNAIDDIFWYAPGPAADYLWRFAANGSHTSQVVNVGGAYRPVVSEVNGDGYDDIIWYGPGASADSLWRFGPSGSHTSKTLSIGGDYTPIPGYFGDRPEGSPQKRVIWFSKTGSDSIWTFDTSANHTSMALPSVNGNLEPVVGFFGGSQQDVLFYGRGSIGEQLIGFTDAGVVEMYEPPNVGGTYDHTVGDFDGNGYEDIAWAASGKAYVWKFNGAGYSQTVVTTNTTNTVVRTAFAFPSL